MSIFSGRHFPKEEILWAVRWYCLWRAKTRLRFDRVFSDRRRLRVGTH